MYDGTEHITRVMVVAWWEGVTIFHHREKAAMKMVSVGDGSNGIVVIEGVKLSLEVIVTVVLVVVEAVVVLVLVQLVV